MTIKGHTLCNAELYNLEDRDIEKTCYVSVKVREMYYNLAKRYKKNTGVSISFFVEAAIEEKFKREEA